MTKQEQQQRKMLLEKIKEEYGLKSVTLEEFKDKYGMMINIKELNSCNYKRDFNEHLKRIIEEHQYATSKDTLKKLRSIATRDNMYARFLGKREYKVISVYTSVAPYLGFGALIEFKDNGERRYVYETGLTYCLSGRFEKEQGKGTSWWYGRKNRTYFTAGGLADKEADFIFHGVGFSSKNDMYSCREQCVLR